jgi:hypothetical protein
VRMFAPVFPGVVYRQADPIGDYAQQFTLAMKEHPVRPLFACNCILNFLYANLEGPETKGLVSAMTFGEIAYMLLNQTLVYLTLDVN